MADIRPFRCVRPDEAYASQVAALPYDVFSREEAAAFVAGRPLSFLNIDRPETQFEPGHDMYAPEVYERARQMLEDWIERGILVQEAYPCYYIYEEVMNGRSQTGVVALSSVDEYLDGTIRRHENTREEKEQDRIRHVDALSAQTGPIFLAYRSSSAIRQLVENAKEKAPLYDFVSEDGVTHRVWRIDAILQVEQLKSAFEKVPCTYIADGHHRCASAVKVAIKRRQQAAAEGKEGPLEADHFLSVLFPDEELEILPYNRVVRDLNGLEPAAFLEKLAEKFEVEELPADIPPREASPRRKGQMSLYLDGRWYRMTARPEVLRDDPVEGLDVSILQNEVLRPLLGIQDPRTDTRIDFIGGIRGNEELVKRAGSDMRLAFAMYPTSIAELFAVADAGLLMPPKSTWFEPKLRSGLFIHRI